MDISKIAATGTPKSKMIYHEDTQQLHVNTLDKHRYFIPFDKEQDTFADRESSERFELLNGQWDLRCYESIVDMKNDRYRAHLHDFTVNNYRSVREKSPAVLPLRKNIGCHCPIIPCSFILK